MAWLELFLRNMQLPTVRIVPTEFCILHETTDQARVARLARAFKTSDVFTNPPIVTSMGRGKYMVLDGANRVTVSRRLGFPHIPVQVVDYADSKVELHTWNHIIDGVTWKRWRHEAEAALGEHFRHTTRASAERGLRKGSLCAYIVSPSGEYRAVGASSAPEQVTLLNNLVETYKGIYGLHRTTEDDMQGTRRAYPRFVALVVFPNFSKQSLLRFAAKGTTIPSGISRHIIPGRVLRLDVPFALLGSKRSLAAKNTWLTRTIKERLSSNKIRFYNEPVYMYDE